MSEYNFAYLDEQTKRMIRRAILKGLAIPGYQVPFASREMPMPYGWGTGGVQVSAAVMTADDVFKVFAFESFGREYLPNFFSLALRCYPNVSLFHGTCFIT